MAWIPFNGAVAVTGFMTDKTKAILIPFNSPL
jgi:hypothetical protein